MRFIPGSHNGPHILPHVEKNEPGNLLSRGQTIEDVELAAVAGGLLPAQQRHRRNRAVAAVGLELFLSEMLGHDDLPVQTLPIPDL